MNVSQKRLGARNGCNTALYRYQCEGAKNALSPKLWGPLNLDKVQPAVKWTRLPLSADIYVTLGNLGVRMFVLQEE